jgi:hypothetical protein
LAVSDHVPLSSLPTPSDLQVGQMFIPFFPRLDEGHSSRFVVVSTEGLMYVGAIYATASISLCLAPAL